MGWFSRCDKFRFMHCLQEMRQQLLNEIRTLCEAPQVNGLVEFYGAFYSPDSGQISIALEYMDGGSLADIVRAKKFVPEPILSVITRNVLHVRFLSPRYHWRGCPAQNWSPRFAIQSAIVGFSCMRQAFASWTFCTTNPRCFYFVSQNFLNY